MEKVLGKSTRGESLVEYGLILALLALMAVPALGYLSDKIDGLLTREVGTPLFSAMTGQPAQIAIHTSPAPLANPLNPGLPSGIPSSGSSSTSSPGFAFPGGTVQQQMPGMGNNATSVRGGNGLIGLRRTPLPRPVP